MDRHQLPYKPDMRSGRTPVLDTPDPKVGSSGRITTLLAR